MSALYPLKFHPIYKEKIWGGQKIKTVLNQDYGNLPNCGEVWVISGVNDNVSIVSEGTLKGQSIQQIINEETSHLLGEKVFHRFGREFPLLIKFIDAADDLSVQVHPNDEVAEKKHQCKGKSEMWYIIETDEDASIIIGFNQKVDKEKLRNAFYGKTVMSHLNRVNVHPGDVFYLPAGRVHSIGAGCLLAEIQQTSDITYRIYDFDRPNADGQLRELHVEDGLEVCDYMLYDNYHAEYAKVPNQRSTVVDTPFFNTKIIKVDKVYDFEYPNADSFRIYICTRGQGVIRANDHDVNLVLGEAVLLPAVCRKVSFSTFGEFELLETGLEY